MLLSRVLGAVGRFCISLGVLTLLFVAYQLWGTGILTAQAQNALENDFDERLELVQSLDTELIDAALDEQEAAAAADAGLTPASDDADAGETEAAETPEEREAREAAEEQARRELAVWADLLWVDPGEPVAKLHVPAIDLDWQIVAGVGTDELSKGPGHYPGTPLPGMPGNSGIAGHRTTWGAPFHRIDELQPGDEILVTTLQGEHTYRVVEQESGKGHFIVTPDRVDVLDQDFEEHPNRITLTACHPKWTARQRIIVVGELVTEPSRFVPPPDLLDAISPSLASEDVGDDTDGDADEAETALPGDPDLPVDEDAPTDAAVEADPADEATTVDEAGEGGEGDNADDAEPESVPAVIANDTGDPQTALQDFAAGEDFGQGLNGDRSAIMPAIMWGLAAAAIAAVAGFIGRRWKKLPSYVLALAPFAIVLFVCFVHIDQALPSY